MFGRSVVGKTRFKVPPERPPEEPPPPPELPIWIVALPIFEVRSEPFDIGQTLPASIVRGGVFGIHESGDQLTQGMTLSPDGMLDVSEALPGARVDGVVFSYVEP